MKLFNRDYRGPRTQCFAIPNSSTAFLTLYCSARGSAAPLPYIPPRTPHHVVLDIIITPPRATRVRAPRLAPALTRRAVPRHEECPTGWHARADEGYVHLDRCPQPPDIAIPRHVICFPHDNDEIHEPDSGGGDDEQAGGEEGYEVDLLGCADTEGEEGSKRDEENDNVNEDVEGGADDHVHALFDAGADGTGDENFPVVCEGSALEEED
ncbi:hypothetical protein V498_06427 [Pseudogymnoascus sp. VKM F-4517 (FW-2822)]|nr:hypothetical protein V498_06427 [Pseudogymnoascus sp. VKM F-4517 (FW-2822)]